MKLNRDLNSRIAAFMTDYMKTHGMAQGTLSKALGYKSVTSVVRLLKGRVAYVAVADCLRRFADLPMTEEEASVFNSLNTENLLLIKHGQWLSIINGSAIDPEGCIHLNNRLETINQHLKNAKDLKIRMFGCIVPAITSELLKLLDKGAEIGHFIRIDDGGRSVTSILDASLPLQYSPRYRSYLYDAGKNEVIAGMSADDLLLCSYTDEHDEPHREMIVLTDPTHGFTIQLDPSCNIDDIADKASHHRKTISLSNYHHEDCGKDLAAYADYCSRLEYHVPIRCYKPDIGIELIPVDILSSALRSDLPDDMNDAITKLVDIFKRRWENNLHNPYPQHYIFKRSTLLRFFKTGILSDHPWLLRPFTLAERREILVQLLQRQSTDPNWHMYLLNDDSILCDRMVALYGRTGLCFVKNDISYSLKDELPDALICRKFVMDSFTAFFDDALLGTCTYSEEESLSQLLKFYEQFDQEAIELR